MASATANATAASSAIRMAPSANEASSAGHVKLPRSLEHSLAHFREDTAFAGMLGGSLGPQAIRDSQGSHHRLAGA